MLIVYDSGRMFWFEILASSVASTLSLNKKYFAMIPPLQQMRTIQ